MKPDPSASIEEGDELQPLRWVTGIDPSSTCFGVATLELPACRAWGAWRLTAPSKLRGELQSFARTTHLLEQLGALELPDLDTGQHLVVVESPSPYLSSRAKATGGKSITRYAVAVGRCLEYLRARVPAGRLLEVSERVWSGKQPKGRRLPGIIARFGGSGYDVRADPGHDVADALGIADYAAGRIAAGSENLR